MRNGLASRSCAGAGRVTCNHRTRPPHPHPPQRPQCAARRRQRGRHADEQGRRGATVNAITRLEAYITKSYKRQRAAEDASAKLTIASPRCRIDDATVQAPDGYGIPIRVFTPLDIDFSLKSGLHVNEDHRGTILFFHGGGWANGDIDFYTDSCTRTALRLERRLVSVDYRRSPKHRFPAAIEDCYEVARQLFAGDVIEDVDPDHIVLFGELGRGNITAVVSLMARDRGDFSPKTQMLLYPLTYDDHSETSVFDSVRENGEGYILTREDIVGYIGMYLNGPDDYWNPYFAPLLAAHLARQPRTLVITARVLTRCATRARRMPRALRDADGNEVACFRVLGGVHGYFLYPTVLLGARHLFHNEGVPLRRRASTAGRFPVARGSLGTV